MKEYILEVRKIIPQKLCKKIIHYFDNDYGEAGTVGSGVNKDIRNCLTRSILETKSFGEKICSNLAKEKIFECVSHYKDKHSVEIKKISQLDILRYDTNKYKAGYNFHNDFGHEVNDRHLSISVCLNNEYEGGEFVFDLPSGHYVIPQNVGDAVVFPSNFMFPHQVNKITKGTRYALIGWVI
jgi:Rps23 Pro-64 3,4-dihydroxylase Tpa1-like proline 4-hydroxylase|tara:strand:+ start:2412 stop:2957 length:546 start_codon:yes stop_codon:yes gene_type:complete